MNELTNEQQSLFREVPPSPRLRFYHDRIRDAVLGYGEARHGDCLRKRLQRSLWAHRFLGFICELHGDADTLVR